MQIGSRPIAFAAVWRWIETGRLCSPTASALLALGLILATASGGGTAEVSARGEGDAGGIRMTVVPAGPVSDQTRVEIRVGLENDSSAPRQYDVQFFLDRPEPTAEIGRQTVTVPACGRALARCWWETRGKPGKHQLVCRAESGGQATERLWPIEVVASDTPGLPFFQGVWLEPGAIAGVCETDRLEETEANVRASSDAICRLEMNMMVLVAAQYNAVFYYPSPEVWEMDGTRGYSHSFPAAFDRVKRQIEIERKYTPVLTAYPWHNYLHDPASGGNKVDPRAVQLFESYSAWKKQQDRARKE